MIAGLWNYPPNHSDFKYLDAQLKAGNWEKADRETSEIIVALATKENSFQRRLRMLMGEPVYYSGRIDMISCKDLLTIDKLWKNYSVGRFGFSTQQKIWSTFYDGNIPSGSYEVDYRVDRYKLFASQVGWRNSKGILYIYDDLNFTLEAPKGQFPSWIWMAEGPEYGVSKPYSHSDFKLHYMLKRVEFCYLNKVDESIRSPL